MFDMLNASREELESFIADLKAPRFRADQIWRWLWLKGVQSFEHMTNLSKDFRSRLEETSFIRWPGVHTTRSSQDGTIKFLLELHDQALIETVLIPAPGKEYFTLCISSQVGCALACEFCATGRMGFTRNLSMAEILGQILVARAYIEQQDLPWKLRNVVFMGMGEPLLNLKQVLRSLEAMKCTEGLGFSSRRVTVSTSGTPKGILEIGNSGLAMLAVSLHAPTQELRARLMPKAARLHLDDLMAILDQYPLKPRERITYEYILLKGINDSLTHAKQLVRLLGQRKAKVNLIAFNAPSGGDTFSDCSFQAPDPETVSAFDHYLHDHGMTVTLRKSMGADIAAACGQLKAETV